MTDSLADQIRAQAAISARPGQLVALEALAARVAELEHERDFMREMLRAAAVQGVTAQRPPLGYVVGFRNAHGLTFSRDYGGPYLTRAAAEQEMAHEAKENPEVKFKLIGLWEVQS